MWDELDEPLGVVSSVAATSAIGRMRLTAKAATGVAVIAAAFGLIALSRQHSPLGSEPFAVAKVTVLPAPRQAQAPDSTASVRQTSGLPTTSAPQAAAATAIKVTRGVGAPPKALIIDVAEALGLKLAPAPDPRVTENSQYGPLPRIGSDGTRPFDVYSRAPTRDSARVNSARIALVMSGLGLDAENTQKAIVKLPGAVTLAFAAYGAATKESAAQAREAGHETALQTSMEGSSDSAGGSRPRALRASAPDAENLDSLRWMMSRFTGYVAVINDFGGKLPPDGQKMSPVMKEIAARGLGYLDASGSPRGADQDIAVTPVMPSAHADVVIDANTAPEAIDAALTRLLNLARQRGSAIGFVAASPAAIERLARWTSGLESKGAALAPVSALMSQTVKASAQALPEASP